MPIDNVCWHVWTCVLLLSALIQCCLRDNLRDSVTFLYWHRTRTFSKRNVLEMKLSSSMATTRMILASLSTMTLIFSFSESVCHFSMSSWLERIQLYCTLNGWSEMSCLKLKLWSVSACNCFSFRHCFGVFLWETMPVLSHSIFAVVYGEERLLLRLDKWESHPVSQPNNCLPPWDILLPHLCTSC